MSSAAPCIFGRIKGRTGKEDEWRVLLLKESEERLIKHPQKILQKGDIVALPQSETQTLERLPVKTVSNALTFDTPNTKKRDDAITIEDCGVHGNQCKRIGVHISAVALCKIPKRLKLPIYDRRYFYLDKKQEDQWSLNAQSPQHPHRRNSPALAISVYYDCSTKGAGDPEITEIEVEHNYSFEDEKAYEKHLKPLWDHFFKNNCGSLDNQQFKYIANHSKGMKVAILIDKLMSIYSKKITEYTQKHQDIHFVTCPTPSDSLDESHDVFIPEKLLDDANSFIELSKGDDMVLPKLVAAGLQSQMIWRDEVDHFSEKYQRAVENWPSISTNGSVVKCTSPLRNPHDLVNQQILLHCMMGLQQELYSKEDLLGLLVIRFDQPRLMASTVQGFTSCAIKLNYQEVWYTLPSTLTTLPFNLLTEEAVGSESASFSLRNLGYGLQDSDLNSENLIRLDSGKFKAFSDLFKEGASGVNEDGKSARHVFREMLATKDKQAPTYEKKENDILVNIQRGTVLQIQLSQNDKNTDLGFRLVRIGCNCHLCLTHVHYPKMAFMSDRKDVRELVDSDTIEALKKQKLHEKLSSTKLYDVRIEWKGDYYSGGSFVTKQGTTVNKRDLLCIRKEIRSDRGLCVWTCHAVVSHTENNHVNFSTCTLSQLEQHDDQSAYCVEVIKNPIPSDS